MVKKRHFNAVADLAEQLPEAPRRLRASSFHAEHTDVSSSLVRFHADPCGHRCALVRPEAKMYLRRCLRGKVEEATRGSIIFDTATGEIPGAATWGPTWGGLHSSRVQQVARRLRPGLPGHASGRAFL